MAIAIHYKRYVYCKRKNSFVKRRRNRKGECQRFHDIQGKSNISEENKDEKKLLCKVQAQILDREFSLTVEDVWNACPSKELGLAVLLKKKCHNHDLAEQKGDNSYKIFI